MNTAVTIAFYDKVKYSIRAPCRRYHRIALGHKGLLWHHQQSQSEGMKEDRESWLNFFTWLKGRGLAGVRLIIGDKCLGMLESIPGCIHTGDPHSYLE